MVMIPNCHRAMSSAFTQASSGLARIGARARVSVLVHGLRGLEGPKPRDFGPAGEGGAAGLRRRPGDAGPKTVVAAIGPAQDGRKQSENHRPWRRATVLVREIMTRPVVTVTPDTSITDALALVAQHHI